MQPDRVGGIADFAEHGARCLQSAGVERLIGMGGDHDLV